MTDQNTSQYPPMEKAIRLVKQNHLTIAMAAHETGVTEIDLLTTLTKPNQISHHSEELPRVMTITISEKRLKKGLMRLKNQMRKSGHHVKHAELLDAAAVFHGFKNWRSMKATGFETMASVDEESDLLIIEGANSKRIQDETP